MAGQHDHGHTPAAWTAVTIAFIGFCLGSYFTVVAQPWGVAASGVVLLIAGVVGLVMKSMGLGQQPAPVRTAKPAAAAAGTTRVETTRVETAKVEAAEAETPKPAAATS
ncbi:HGxxPAAW family protein [Streptomyces sp. DSM 44915]|uniref:HGxxPAAW family protein n=1 Tax=Streptomyces chisholmiae TaxID=3075540 RepID=A0ABU2JJ74_9ACTN|nr:HGxxPAAW family protein [Streptomyces sp. DSM 44915]MDT0265034.1 HGxxPAAW family protein [Streptomyces sp. DSM 44915]